MRYLKIFSQFSGFNVVNNGSDGDPGCTPRITLTALFCEMSGGSLFVLHADPQIRLQYIMEAYMNE